MSAETGNTRLYLVVEAGEGASDRLVAALGSTPAASVLVKPAGSAPLSAEDARPLVEIAQSKGAAVLLWEDAALALQLEADGVHIPVRDDPVQSFRAAREILGTRRIVGADAGPLRHNAMILGEEGADYVGFGLAPDVPDPEEAANERLDLVSWWGEIFEIPCVAFDVANAEEAEALTSAGADFVAVDVRGDGPATAAEHVSTVARGLRSAAMTK